MSEATTVRTYILGDSNFDGKADTLEFAMMKLMLAGIGEYTEAQADCLDLNGDGKTDTLDFAMFKLILAGIQKLG